MRCPTFLAALAACFCLTAFTTPAGAQSSDTGSGSTTPYYAQPYTLTIPAGGIPLGDSSATTPELVFPNTPSGAIVAPPDPNNPGQVLNPMTYLPDSIGYSSSSSSSSSSKSPYVIFDLLKTDGSQFGLSFFPNPNVNPPTTAGLVPGDIFHVTLDINQALQSNPPTFVSNLPGVSLMPDATSQSGTSTSTTTTTTPTTMTPEPFSLVVWSALTGLGLWHARRMRRTPSARPC
jgi:hypothetical protein